MISVCYGGYCQNVHSGQNGSMTRRGRVLLVDGRSHGAQLGRDGFEVTTSRGAAEATAILERDLEGFDVVVSDVGTKRSEGLALLDRVRSLRPEMPVVLMSDRPDNALAVAAGESGAWCLVKPIAAGELSRALDVAVRRKGTSSRRAAPAPASSVTATEAKNAFAELLESSAQGPVTITKHEKPKAVLVSYDHYLELSQTELRRLDTLSDEFDALLDRMQQPAARTRMKQAFAASPKALGRAALAAARKK